jgi:hypothetical protein
MPREPGVSPHKAKPAISVGLQAGLATGVGEPQQSGYAPKIATHHLVNSRRFQMPDAAVVVNGQVADTHITFFGLDFRPGIGSPDY